jgi:hypothetical protein
MVFEIYNKNSCYCLGFWRAASEEEAWQKMCKEASWNGPADKNICIVHRGDLDGLTDDEIFNIYLNIN